MTTYGLMLRLAGSAAPELIEKHFVAVWLKGLSGSIRWTTLETPIYCLETGANSRNAHLKMGLAFL